MRGQKSNESPLTRYFFLIFYNSTPWTLYSEIFSYYYKQSWESEQIRELYIVRKGAGGNWIRQFGQSVLKQK